MSIVARLSGAGMAADDAAATAVQVARVQAAFAAHAGAPPTWSWFVPGRLELFGKHTDYGGGRTLVAAVPRGFAVAAGPRADGRVRVRDLRAQVATDIDPADETRTLIGWASYVQVVARRLARNFPAAPLGLDLMFSSDLPRAAGMSSSSALVVAVATALSTRARLGERDEWLANLGTVADVASYFGCIENGLDYRGLPGTAGVGTHGGSEDHTAIMACRAGHVSQFRFMPATPLGDTPVPPHWTFVVASSGVHADKAGSVKDRFNRAALGARAVLACWNRGEATPARSLAQALARAGALDQLRTRIAAAPGPEFTADALLRRLAHFVAEDARVPEAAQACGAADAATIGRLAAASQHDAEQILENQVPETSALVALARACGAHGATSFGAGFGGSAWALVATADVDAFAAEWLSAYAKRFPTRAGVEWFAARPSPPMTDVGVT
ncbi:MAG: galactokinase family protein [Acidobacteriota bacterium]